MFTFDGEFSIVAPDFDLGKRQKAIDSQALKYKSEIEYVGRIKFQSVCNTMSEFMVSLMMTLAIKDRYQFWTEAV